MFLSANNDNDDYDDDDDDDEKPAENDVDGRRSQLKMMQWILSIWSNKLTMFVTPGIKPPNEGRLIWTSFLHDILISKFYSTSDHHSLIMADEVLKIAGTTKVTDFSWFLVANIVYFLQSIFALS